MNPLLTDLLHIYAVGAAIIVSLGALFSWLWYVDRRDKALHDKRIAKLRYGVDLSAAEDSMVKTLTELEKTRREKGVDLINMNRKQRRSYLAAEKRKKK